MLCKHCGTEIADKALICFRCGKATTDPVFKPPPAPGARSSSSSLLVSALVLAVLVLVALYLWRASYGETPRLATWAAVAVAVIVVAFRAYARRR